MWLNDTLIKFIESSSEITKLTIYISDLKKIKICAMPNKNSKKVEKIISRELLETLLIIGTGAEQDRYTIANSEEETIPILEDHEINLSMNSQIILPIWVDNELKGSIILSNPNRKLDEYDFELSKCIQMFIEEAIINSINDEFLAKKELKKNKITIDSSKRINEEKKPLIQEENLSTHQKENLEEEMID